jgi:hypothetical protein
MILLTLVLCAGLAYLAFAPKPSPLGGLIRGDYWRLAFVAILALIIIGMIIFSLATRAMLSSWVLELLPLLS